MNRLRFRVWDKEVQEFAHWPVYFNLTNSEIVTELWYGYEIQVEEPLQDSNYIVQQSTGLLDKNGKEIFEGDIVNIHAFYFDGCSESEQEHIGIIHYGNIAGFLIKEWYLETMDNKIAFSDLELHEESFEILGNIYEHPHLLGED